MSVGYACLVIGVPGTELSRCTLKNAAEEKLRSIICHNLAALEAIIDYNIRNDIRFFRISSDIIPFGSHPVNRLAWWEDYGDTLSVLGKKIMDNNIRVSMHPGQYTVLNSPGEKVRDNSIRDLVYHDRFLNALGMDRKSRLVLHIGGVYGDKKEAAQRFVKNCKKLPDSVKNRLILENDDKNYTVEEVLNIAYQTGSPVVFDNLHNALNPSSLKLSEREWIRECGRTWKEEDGRPKVHYSQQGEGAAPGSHSKTIFIRPFLEFYPLVPVSTDIMLEVKDKNLSAVKCINTACRNAKGMDLEKEWTRYKYFVLSRSVRIYKEICQLLKEKESLSALDFYCRIETALKLPEDMEAEITAADHVWGYIGKDCGMSEKKRYEKLMEDCKKKEGSISAVKKHLLKCVKSRELNFLLDSYYFYL